MSIVPITASLWSRGLEPRILEVIMTYINIARSGKNSLRRESAAILTAAIGLCGVFATPVMAANEALTADLLSKLRSGGYVIYIRHASTETDYADQINAVPANCATQRTLSDKGWQEAMLIGASFDALSIPVGAVYSSEYCRAWQTAELAFGRSVRLEELNFEPAEEYTDEQMETMRARVLPLLQTKPLTGTNTVFVGHDDPFEAATGIYPEPQGVTFLLKTDSEGQLEIAGAIHPGDWPELLSLR